MFVMNCAAFSFIFRFRLLRHLFKPFQHEQHGEHGNAARYYKYRPRHPDRNTFVKDSTDNEQLITNGSSAEPTALHDTLIFGRSHLGHE